MRSVGGESGIRTRVTVSRKHTFQACAFNHSATSPSMHVASAGFAARVGEMHLPLGKAELPPSASPTSKHLPLHLSRRSNRRGAHLVDPAPNAKPYQPSI